MTFLGGQFTPAKGGHFEPATLVNLNWNQVVTLTRFCSEGTISNYNKEVLKRIEDIENLDEDTKNKLFFLIDNVIQNYKTKQAFK